MLFLENSLLKLSVSVIVVSEHKATALKILKSIYATETCTRVCSDKKRKRQQPRRIRSQSLLRYTINHINRTLYHTKPPADAVRRTTCVVYKRVVYKTVCVYIERSFRVHNYV